MHVGSPVPKRKARLEIIPLIDVMFFLLAAFMMVSLSMQKLQTIRMNLPAAVAAQANKKPEIINVDISASGDISVEKKQVTLPQLEALIADQLKSNTNLPVYLRAAPLTRHGRVLEVLDAVKSVTPTVSFAIDPPKDGA